MKRRQTSFRHLFALVVVAIAAGAIAARADGPAPRPRPVAPARLPAPSVPPVRLLAAKVPCVPRKQHTAAPTPPSKTLLDAFGVLRRERRPDDALSADALDALRRAGLAPVAPESARLLRSTPSGGRAWVVPVPDVRGTTPFACGSVGGEGLAVVSVGDAAAGGGGALADLVRGRAPVSVDACAGERHDLLSVSGIVPDGVPAVFLTSPDGTAVRADVKDNGYEFLVPRSRTLVARYVVWTGADGTPHVQPMPGVLLPAGALCARIAKAGAAPTITPGPYFLPCGATPVPVPVAPLVVPHRDRARPVPVPPPLACQPALVPAPRPTLIRPKRTP